MIGSDRATGRILSVLVVTLVMLAGACKVSVGDFEKWRNRRGSEEQFVEWMLAPDASDEVRAKAIEMLFEQYNYEGDRFLPRVGELPAERRHRAIQDALPRIIELYRGAQYSLGGSSLVTLQPVRVRDGVMALLQVTEDDAVRERLNDVLVFWLEEHHEPCVTSVGRHPNSRILSAVGVERGLPIVAHFIREGSHDSVLCQSSYLGSVTWIREAADALATAYIERWEQNRPADLQGQLDLVECMVAVPGSTVLKGWIFQQLTSADSSLLANFVDAFLQYVQPLAGPDDLDQYIRMIQIYHGNLRWIAVEEALAVAGAQGLARALDALPADPPQGTTDPANVQEPIPWGLWGGQVLDDGLARAAEYLCQRPSLQAIAQQVRTVFEERVGHANVVVRAISIRCLADVGGASSIQPLRLATGDNAIIPAWSTAGTAISSLAREVLGRLNVE